MDLFRGKTLIQKDGSEHLADDVLKDASVLALFFSAGWCPSCRLFTPLLARAYKAQRKVEVVFVSEDRSSFAMIGYMRQSHGDWYAVKYGDPLQEELKTKYGISNIPALVAIKKDGSVISANGLWEVITHGSRALRAWVEPTMK
ncbi:nucleoredoxin-like protein 2 [Amblyomma americanum]